MKILILILSFSIVSFTQDWVELTKKSNQLLSQRKFEKALEASNQALTKVTQLYGENTDYQATQYGQIGKIYFFWGKYQKAEDYYKKQLQLLEKIRGKNNIAYAQALNNLSVIYNALGRNDLIEKNLQESISIKEALGDADTSYAKSLNNLGQIYLDKGKYPEAEKFLKKSLEIKLNKIGEESSTTAMSYLNLGNLHNAVGNKDEALKDYLKAYQIFKKTTAETNPDRLTSIFQLATINSILGNNDEAKKLLNEAEDIQKIDPSNINFESANAMYNLAQLKIRLGLVEDAKEILLPIIEPFKSKIGAGHPLFAKLLRTSGIACWQTADLDNAYNFIMQNKEITRQLYGEKSRQFGESCHLLAGLMKDLEYFEEADKNYNQAFQIYLYQIENFFPHYSESEKTKFYRLIKERFEMFNSYVLQRHKVNPKILGDMYNYQIATKGILLDYSKNISGLVEKSGDMQLIEKYRLWSNKKKQLAELFNKSKLELQKKNIDIDKIINGANELEKEISVKISELDPDSFKAPKWTEIQKKLKPNEAALEIIRFKFFGRGWADTTFYAALILTSETTQHPEIVIYENGNVLDGTLLRRYKKTVKAKFPDKRSYKYYWEKIDKKLTGKDKIYISADGAYNLINISSIMKPNGKYLLEEKTFIHLNNTKELLDRKQVSSKAEKIYLFGDPKYDLAENIQIKKKAEKADPRNKTIISPLPGTEIEVKKISEIIQNNGIPYKAYVNKNASETNFKNIEKPRILHIATHGYFLADVNEIEGNKVFGVDLEQASVNPLLRAGLLFSGASSFLNYDASQDNQNNGILTAYEVKNMDLRETELVVLSACETGLGEVMNGEGVYGLQRAFQVAGANSIIMSLWTVDDRTTQELMVAFYDNYFSGKDIIQSFRDARLEIRKKYSDPYYWGAFKLLGGI